MNEPLPGYPGLRARALGLVRLPLAAVVAAGEWSLSRRGLALLFLAGVAFWATASWVRPPLSRDVSGLHIPLGVWETAGQEPEGFLHGPRRPEFASPGGLLLALAGLGAAVVLARPRRLGAVAGVALAAAVAANAAVALNHPALVEAMDREYEQRQQVVSVLTESKQQPLATRHNGPIDQAPDEDQQRADLGRGLAYLLGGRWLILWAGAAVLLGTSGPFRGRLKCLALAGLLGLLLAGGFCSRRLGAEYHWARANALEQAGDRGAAREALREAVALFPEFDRLERTWLLAGKLDHRAGSPTPQERFFRAYQLARSKVRPRTAAHGEDLPWLITGPVDLPDGLPMSRGPAFRAYQGARDRELRLARAAMDDLLGEGGSGHPAVLHQAARLETDRGLASYRHIPAVTDAGLDGSASDRQVTAARGAWVRAARLVPGKSDCVFYLTRTGVLVDAGRAEGVEAEAAPLLLRLGDRTLCAELLNDLGDAYLEAGRVRRARSAYAESCETFCLPETINYRALKRLGGL